VWRVPASAWVVVGCFTWIESALQRSRWCDRSCRAAPQRVLRSEKPGGKRYDLTHLLSDRGGLNGGDRLLRSLNLWGDGGDGLDSRDGLNGGDLDGLRGVAVMEGSHSVDER
jgi:hypothetical protein